MPKRILKKEQSILLPKMFCIARIISCQYDRMAGQLKIYGNVLPAVLHISSNTCILLLEQQQFPHTDYYIFAPSYFFYNRLINCSKCGYCILKQIVQTMQEKAKKNGVDIKRCFV